MNRTGVGAERKHRQHGRGADIDDQRSLNQKIESEYGIRGDWRSREKRAIGHDGFEDTVVRKSATRTAVKKIANGGALYQVAFTYPRDPPVGNVIVAVAVESASVPVSADAVTV